MLCLQEPNLDPEILLLFERMPMLEVEIGAAAVAQPQHEPRQALVKFAVGPEGLHVLYVAPAEAMQVGVQDMERMAELVDPLEGAARRGLCLFARPGSSLHARPMRRHGRRSGEALGSAP